MPNQHQPLQTRRKIPAAPPADKVLLQQNEREYAAISHGIDEGLAFVLPNCICAILEGNQKYPDLNRHLLAVQATTTYPLHLNVSS